MKIYITYNISTICRIIIREQLEMLQIRYELKDLGEVVIVPPEDRVIQQLIANLQRYGISLVLDTKSQLLQKIRNVIDEVVEQDGLPISKISYHLSVRLGMNYAYLSTFFSENTYTSIERYIILKKIEKVKQLLLQELSLTEISYILNYSSVAHLFQDSSRKQPGFPQRCSNGLSTTGKRQ